MRAKHMNPQTKSQKEGTYSVSTVILSKPESALFIQENLKDFRHDRMGENLC